MSAGLVALGDSITYGHGGMQSGFGCQSWAMWLAEAMELPFTRYAVNGATVDGVVAEQLPRLERDGRRYDVGCLYIGVNDVRRPAWDARAYEAGLAEAFARLAPRCERVVTLTIPLALGLPPAGPKVEDANAAIERVAAAHGAAVADLRDFDRRAWVWADRVHATATGQVEIADRAARALGAPLPSAAVTDVPRPGLTYAAHYTRRALRERARVLRLRLPL